MALDSIEIKRDQIRHEVESPEENQKRYSKSGKQISHLKPVNLKKLNNDDRKLDQQINLNTETARPMVKDEEEPQEANSNSHDQANANTDI